MEKAKHPTSQYKVFCDTFDMIGTAKIDDDGKLNLSLETEDGKSKQSLSLFREDVEMLTMFLDSINRYIKERD